MFAAVSCCESRYALLNQEKCRHLSGLRPVPLRRRLMYRAGMFGFGSWTDVIWWITGNWFAFKVVVEDDLAINDNLLHLLAGGGFQLVICGLLRVPLSNPWPWAAVLIAESLNEANDLYWAWGGSEATLIESVKDILVTMLFPTLVLLGAVSRRYRAKAGD